MNKLNEKDALIEAYNSLIQSHEEVLGEYIEEYNTEMLRQAAAKIQSDLRENGIHMSLEIPTGKDLTTIQYNIQLWEHKVNNLKASKERMIK